jgi:Tfp pilus assembly protein PilF
MRAILPFLLCLLLGAVEAGSDSAAAGEKTKAALALLERGNLEQAIVEFRQALAGNPGDVDAQLGLAFAYDMQGRTEEAIQEYQTALKLQPQNALALSNLGVLYDKTGRHEEAIRYFEKALENDPGNHKARNNLANSLKNKALVSERTAKFQAARKNVEANPKSPRASYELARLHAAYGEKEEAFNWLEIAIKLGFNDFDYLKRDPAIEPIRMDPRFTRILKGS